ncbi:nucleotidyl transferase [Corchorus olitorius]|uniref:Nucleotidyl transferase n=1 Tax=Corchorus olitorius TaxID=93759 RepID=A0A1R3GCD0_9ROSI|nr:nucleotidyl transferase [Corchorus olitorius]
MIKKLTLILGYPNSRARARKRKRERLRDKSLRLAKPGESCAKGKRAATYSAAEGDVAEEMAVRHGGKPNIEKKGEKANPKLFDAK